MKVAIKSSAGAFFIITAAQVKGKEIHFSEISLRLAVPFAVFKSSPLLSD